MAKTFELDTTVSPSSLLARAKKAAYANGATLLGDERSGTFSHENGQGRVPYGETQGYSHRNR